VSLKDRIERVDVARYAQPAAIRPITKKTATVKKPVVKKAVAEKLVAKKVEPKTPATKKPNTSESEFDKLEPVSVSPPTPGLSDASFEDAALKPALEIGPKPKPDDPNPLSTGGVSEKPSNLPVERATRDVVRLNYDGPTAVDALNRLAYAESIAQKINEVMIDPDNRQSTASFAIHLHGQWGAGKTSFLNLLEQELRKPDPVSKTPSNWVFVDFNAWEHQRIEQPWWAIYRKIFDSILAADNFPALESWARRLMSKRREFIWRATVGSWVNVAIAITGLVLLTYVGFKEWHLSKAWPSDVTKSFISFLAGLVGLFVTVGGLIKGFAEGLLGGSKAAKGFVEGAGDPMQKLRDHYMKLISNSKKRVLVFIDDIDRCTPAKVVSVLEGMQTVLGNHNVAWVVAGDGRWIASAFETNFGAAFSGSGEVIQPGNRFGYQFLEKLFQLTIALPVIDDAVKLKYWQRIIRDKSEADRNGTGQQEEDTTTAKGKFQSAKSEDDVLDILKKSLDDDPGITVPLRQEAVRKLTSLGVEEIVNQFLSNFSYFLRPNPRAMKRLANCYTIFRDSAVLSGIMMDKKDIARCAILALDSPLLLDAIERDPDLLNTRKAPKKMEPLLRRLWDEDRTQWLIFGFVRSDFYLNPVSRETIKTFSRLRG
jgi:hypothetical protein